MDIPCEAPDEPVYRCQHCLLDLVHQERDRLEGRVSETGAQETVAGQVSNASRFEVIHNY